MNVRYRYDTNRVIPIPSGMDDDGTGRAWARTAAAEYAAHIRDEIALDETAVSRIENLVADLVRASRDGRSAALFFLPEPQIAAPFTVMYSPDRPSRDEQEDFLWPRSCLLRPVHEMISAGGLGAGSSVAIVQRVQERTFAERRWLFLGERGAVAVTLGPVPVPILSLVDPLTETIIDTLSVDEYVPEAGGDGAKQIADAFERDEERWAV